MALRSALILAATCAAVASGTASQPTDRADLIVRNVSVLDPGGARWLPGHDVVVRGTTIAEVKPTGGPLPPAKTSIDGAGKFAIPGLFDNHVHFARFTPEHAGVLLAYGVTSVRDMGTDPEQTARWRRDIARGVFLGPRIVRACGAMLEGSGAPRVDHWVVDRPDAAAQAIDRLAAHGMDCVKVRTIKDGPTYQAIGDAARARGLMLTGHAPEPLTTLEAVAAGQRTFEHAFYPYPLSKVPAGVQQATFEALVKSGAAHVPTLVAWEPSAMTAAQLRTALQEVATTAPSRLPPSLHAHWEAFVPTHEKQGRGSPGWRSAVDTAAADIGTMHKAGVLILPGTDTGAPFVAPGIALHDELRLLVQRAGMTNAEALASATLRSAVFQGRGSDLGSIAPGKIADIVVLTGDPLADIGHTRAIDAVVFRGEALTRAHLNQMLSRTITGKAGTRHD